MKTGIYFGSTMGVTERIASNLAEKLAKFGDVTVHNVGIDGLAGMAACDLILLGTSTWGEGELQDDWLAHQELPGVELDGKTVALFGTGDAAGYPDTFVDGMGVLAAAAAKAGARRIGAWPTDGYGFDHSAALHNGQFVGLALDEDNQPEQTEARIEMWVAQLKAELGAEAS